MNADQHVLPREGAKGANGEFEQEETEVTETGPRITRMRTANKSVQTDLESEFSDPRRVRRFAQVMEHYPSRMGLFRKVYRGKASPRQCIKAFCLECNGWEEAAIRGCTATACPIWGLRPYRVAQEKEKK